MFGGHVLVPGRPHRCGKSLEKLIRTLCKEALSESTVGEWCKHFKNGDWSAESEEKATKCRDPKDKDALPKLRRLFTEAQFRV